MYAFLLFILPGLPVIQLFPTFPEIASSDRSPRHAAFVECQTHWKCDHTAVSWRHLVVLLRQHVSSLLLVEKWASVFAFGNTGFLTAWSNVYVGNDLPLKTQSLVMGEIRRWAESTTEDWVLKTFWVCFIEKGLSIKPQYFFGAIQNVSLATSIKCRLNVACSDSWSC